MVRTPVLPTLVPLTLTDVDHQPQSHQLSADGVDDLSLPDSLIAQENFTFRPAFSPKELQGNQSESEAKAGVNPNHTPRLSAFSSPATARRFQATRDSATDGQGGGETNSGSVEVLRSPLMGGIQRQPSLGTLFNTSLPSRHSISDAKLSSSAFTRIDINRSPPKLVSKPYTIIERAVYLLVLR